MSSRLLRCFPELSCSLFFLSSDDSYRRVVASEAGDAGLLGYCQWPPLGSLFWLRHGQKLSGRHSSWSPYLPFNDKIFVKSQWRWKSWPKQMAVTQAFSGGKLPKSLTSWGGHLWWCQQTSHCHPLHSCSRIAFLKLWTCLPEFAFWNYSDAWVTSDLLTC